MSTHVSIYHCITYRKKTTPISWRRDKGSWGLKCIGWFGYLNQKMTETETSIRERLYSEITEGKKSHNLKKSKLLWSSFSNHFDMRFPWDFIIYAETKNIYLVNSRDARAVKWGWKLKGRKLINNDIVKNFGHKPKFPKCTIISMDGERLPTADLKRRKSYWWSEKRIQEMETEASIHQTTNLTICLTS